jgi:hypothetical protein
VSEWDLRKLDGKAEVRKQEAEELGISSAFYGRSEIRSGRGGVPKWCIFGKGQGGGRRAGCHNGCPRTDRGRGWTVNGNRLYIHRHSIERLHAINEQTKKKRPVPQNEEAGRSLNTLYPLNTSSTQTLNTTQSLLTPRASFIVINIRSNLLPVDTTTV